MIDLTSLSATDGFIIQGDTAGDQAGVSVAPAGDVNGDGFVDMIVGAWLGDDGGADAGEAYVVFGKSTAFGTAVGSRQVVPAELDAIISTFEPPPIAVESLSEYHCLYLFRGSSMKSASVIHSDPAILGSTPVFVGTRVPLQALIDYIEGGHSLEEFLDDFPTVTRALAVAALEQAKAHLIADARAA